MIARSMCAGVLLLGTASACSPKVTIAKAQPKNVTIETAVIHLPKAVLVPSNPGFGMVGASSWSTDDGRRLVVIEAKILAAKETATPYQAVLSGEFEAASIGVDEYSEDGLPPAFSKTGVTAWWADGRRSLQADFDQGKLKKFQLFTKEPHRLLFLFEVPADRREFDLALRSLGTLSQN